MLLREVVIYADQRIVDRYKGGFVARFHCESCCITELMWDILRVKKLVVVGESKVCLTFTDEPWSEPIDARPMAGILWPFNFKAYVAESDERKKQDLIAKGMRDAMIWTAQRLKWNVEAISDACEQLWRRELTFTGIGKRSWVSTNKKWKVRIAFIFQISGVSLYGVLYRNRSNIEITRKYLGQGPSEIGCLREYLSEGRWISDSTFELCSTSFIRERWQVEFSDVVQS